MTSSLSALFSLVRRSSYLKSALYSKVGLTQDSTISLAERGLEYPRKQPDEPRATNFFLAFCFVDAVFNARFC